MVLAFLSALIFTQLVSTSTGFCPDFCECANSLTVCTCQAIANRSMTLSSFGQIEYMTRVYVHSCQHLIIPSDTFHEMSIGEELSIIGIENLDIRPFAFRGMTRYPNRVNVQDCKMQTIHGNTFAGLSNSEHVWFKNATIGVIEPDAFRGASHIKYLYFRESRIKRISYAAFGSMNSIQHLFLRGKTKITAMDDHAFLRSSIDHVVIEDAYIDSMNVLALSGFKRIDNFQMINCSIAETNFNNAKRHKATKNGGKFQFQRTEMNRLALAPLANVKEIYFEQCRIQELVHTYKIPLKNVSMLRFQTTLINYIKTKSFASSKNLKDIIFEDCAIDTIHSQAFKGSSGLGFLLFLNTRFTRLDENAFSDVAFETLIFDGCTIEKAIEHNAFNNMKAETFRISTSSVAEIHMNAFKELVCDNFGFEDTRVSHLNELTFESLIVNEFCNITGNHFMSAVSEKSFAGILSSHIHFNTNKFPCKCDHRNSGLLRMLETKSQEWAFDSNYCMVVHRNVTLPIPTHTFIQECPADVTLTVLDTTTDNSYSSGLTCHVFGLITECSCLEHQTVVIDENFAYALSPYTFQLTIADCRSVVIKKMTLSGNVPSISFLTTVVIREMGQLTLDETAFNALYSLRRVTISQIEEATISPHAFNFLPSLDSVTINDVTLKTLRSETFHQCKIRQLTFSKTFVDLIDIGAFANSILDNLTFSHGRVGRLARHAIDKSVSISSLRFSHTWLEKVENDAIFPNEKMDVCFVNNQVECHCENRGLHILLDLNSCDSKSNTCSGPSEAMNKNLEEVFGAQSQFFNEQCMASPLNSGVKCGFSLSLGACLLFLVLM